MGGSAQRQPPPPHEPPTSPSLTSTLAIGEIVEIEPHSEFPLLLYRLRVEPAVEYDDLVGVYVVDAAPGRAG